MLRNPLQEFRRILRFSFVGAVATAIHIGVAMGAIAGLGINPTVGSLVGFAASFFVSFFGHWLVTFQAPGTARDYLPKFAASIMLSLVLSTSITWVLTSLAAIDFKIALASVAVALPVCNYLLNRCWVFFQPKLDPLDRELVEANVRT